ncbi:MAG: iron-containing alcohol dehydrogenase [Lachnospiraceae bacterium]|nr:iron-containing alcohol dehydrogenase [Lachnospiraceae bacterium]
MDFTYYNPVHAYFGAHCIEKHPEEFTRCGRRALLVTGRSSRVNGSLDDVTSVLDAAGIAWDIFDEVQQNPTIASVRQGAAFARSHGNDFLVAIGGGSPMDTAKGIALLARQDLPDDRLFSAEYYTDDVLPTILIPTTAGTGSEVSEYAVLSDEKAKTKLSISTPLIYPRAAFLDYRYTRSLGRNNTVYPALDALSHSIEGILSQKGDPMITSLALEGIRSIASCFPAMLEFQLTDSDRERLLYGAYLGGLVLAHTSTTVVHAMGHSLTVSRGIVHGRANALCLPGYLRFTARTAPGPVERILEAMSLDSLEEFQDLIDRFLGEKEVLTEEEILAFTRVTAPKRNIPNCLVVPTEADIEAMFREI